MALSNGAQVQRDAVVQEPKCAALAIEGERRARPSRNVEGAVGIAAHVHRVRKQGKRFVVQPYGFVCGRAVDMREPAVGFKPGQALVPLLNLPKSQLPYRANIDRSRLIRDDRQFEARAHGCGGETNDAIRQSRLTFPVRGSKPNAPRSQNDRCARSTITITIVPSSTSLRGCCRVRMQSIQ